MTPGSHPFEELEGALRRIAVHPVASLLDQLTGGPTAIRRAVRRLLPDDPSPLFLVIDQFEELFTQSSEATAAAFLDALAAAVEDEQSDLRVLLTLRADFYDRPLGHRRIGELLRVGTEVITPMSAEELEQAIEGPTAQVGVRFEPTLPSASCPHAGGSACSDANTILPGLDAACTDLLTTAARALDEDPRQWAESVLVTMVRTGKPLADVIRQWLAGTRADVLSTGYTDVNLDSILRGIDSAIALSGTGACSPTLEARPPGTLGGVGSEGATPVRYR
jgi:hypothetical protein